VLDKGETFNHLDLLAAAKAQGIEIQERDILIIRTGWIGSFYERKPESSTRISPNEFRLRSHALLPGLGGLKFSRPSDIKP
jgi:hypothetical protein